MKEWRTGVLSAAAVLLVLVLPVAGCIERPTVASPPKDAGDPLDDGGIRQADGFGDAEIGKVDWHGELPPGDGSTDLPDVACTDECVGGEKKCAGNAVVKCGHYDIDPCVEWGAGIPCPDGDECEDGVCNCMPQCEGKECGDDGCGGSCALCPAQHVCAQNLCVFSEDCGNGSCEEGEDCSNCNPDCKCSEGQKCYQQQCVECAEYCTDMNKECGTFQGCECGTCGQQTTCIDGQCVCEPGCELKECGDDGCGGTCGACADGSGCVNGNCVFSECSDGNSIDWDGCTNGQITEFQVNSYTSGGQWDPSVAPFADGGFVVAWQSGGDQDGSSNGIFGRRYGPDAKPVGGEFQANTYTPGAQENPCVASSPDGRFVVVWQSDDQDGSDEGVYAQRYYANGDKAGYEFQVNAYVADHQTRPRVAAVGGERFVVVWESKNQEAWDPPDNAGYGIFARVYDWDGSTVGGEFLVNTQILSYQKRPGVAGFGDGRFVVAWESGGNQDGSSYGVFGQLYKADSQTKDGVEIMINSWTDDHQGVPSVATFSGGFVAVWESDGQDGSEWSVFGQRYNAGGVKQGGEFQVNAYTDTYQWEASVAAFADGRFVVAWESHMQDGESGGVFGQRFAAGGSKSGPEFQVNTYAAGKQQLASVATFSDGFVVVWASGGQDGDGNGIFAQRYDQNGNKVYD